ncbi:MAG: thioredoxin domain-containing protein [Pseudohongiellaceae bacterium]
MSDNQPNDLEQRLRRAEADKTGTYDKRTEHLNADGSGRFINRLILEDSPYLLQHAHNPVDWYPWGEEAFARARDEHKPVFLSIGYSTCHWCHVMEVESFDNVEVAKQLNADFICIKMDREQYPDIDEVYMTGVQLMSGQGGWPMSNFLLPDGRPFFAATYFPPPTFLKLLEQIAAAWAEKYDELETSAASVDAAIKRILGEHKAVASLDSRAARGCVEALLKREDRQDGGLAGAPKFPQEPLLLFMLDRAARDGDAGALAFVERALDGMVAGGIHDQVAGGFHRYSVDQYWLVPHFEKMLYNQSQLALVLLEAWRQTGREGYRRVLTRTLDYVCRDLQHPDGGFYSATDADSEGEEGTFFLWTQKQLQEVLDAEEYALATEVFDISSEGNFEGSNILCLPRPLEEVAAAGGENFLARLDAILEKLYLARERRVHPLRDDKLIVAWNGTMIHALALAGHALKRGDWVAAAERAAACLEAKNVGGDGRLARICLDGTVSIPGQLEDYANFAQALITLHDVSVNGDYLQLAASLMNYCLEHFVDAQHGSFYLSPADQHGPQLTRSRSAADGATLAAVATAGECLQRLRERAARLDDNPGELYYQSRIDRALASQHAAINEHPLSHTSLLRLIEHVNNGTLESIRYAGAGLVRVSTARQTDAAGLDIAITLSIAPGWHLTAAGQTLEHAVPMALAADQGWSLQEVHYPEALTSIKTADGETLATHEGEVTLTVVLRKVVLREDASAEAASARLALTLQLCDDSQCLLPETLTLLV